MKLLLVEDEPLERIALRGNVIRIYGTAPEILEAEDGLKALDICKAQSPDIVLVDLNIPGISGLELIQALTDFGFTGKILIITAYDTSGYIRQALSLGVVGYLLKPVRTDELKKELEKCMHLLEKEKESREDRIGRVIISSYAEPYLIQDILQGRSPEAMLQKAYGWPEDGQLKAAIFLFSPKNAQSDIRRCFEFSDPLPTADGTAAGWLNKYFRILCGEKDGKLLTFLQAKQEEPAEKVLVNLQAGAITLWREIKEGQLIVTGLASSYIELRKTLLSAEKMAQKRKSGLYFREMASDPVIDANERNKLQKKWQQKFREKNADAFVRMFRRKASAPGCFWGMVSVLLSAWDSYDPSVSPVELLGLLSGEKPYSEFEKWLKHYYETNTQKNDFKKNQGTIQYAVTWMETHYCEDITRFSVAEMLGLSETYFSSLFRQETGQSFVQMLNEIRIRHAIAIIESGETDMDSVSAACGYTNKKYFLEVFKRVTGVRATDYPADNRSDIVQNNPSHTDIRTVAPEAGGDSHEE